jgi:16S rRNA (guanine527-N7)-methyltransferase
MAVSACPCYATRMPGDLTPETEQRLRAYAALLATWTRRINLVSSADQAHIWTRHVLDSLRLVPLIPPGTARAIDLGSGAGLPGLILAIVTGIPVDLVESDRRKAAFLMEAARVTAAPARVHAVRIEACGLVPAPLVMARALAPLDTLLSLASPLLAPGGTLLFPKGVRAAEEIAAARTRWSFDLAEDGTATPVLSIRNPQRATADA